MRNCSAIPGGTPIPAWTLCSRRCRLARRKAVDRGARAGTYSGRFGGWGPKRSASRPSNSPGRIPARRSHACPSPGTAAPSPPSSNCKVFERPAMKRVLLLLPVASYRNADFLAAAEKLAVAIIAAADNCHRLAPLWGMSPIPAVSFDQPETAVKQVVAALGRKPDAVLG